MIPTWRSGSTGVGHHAAGAARLGWRGDGLEPD